MVDMIYMLKMTFQIRAEKLDVLLEVTSPIDLANCKSVMENLISKLLEAGLCSIPTEDCATEGKQVLLIEQVRVVNSDGQLKVVYPSRVDLQIDELIKVIYQEKQ